jgi:hypothetical protein
MNKDQREVGIEKQSLIKKIWNGLPKEKLKKIVIRSINISGDSKLVFISSFIVFSTFSLFAPVIVNQVLAANNLGPLPVNANIQSVTNVSLIDYLKSYASIKSWKNYAKRNFKNSEEFHYFFNSSRNIITKTGVPFIFGGILGTASTKIFYSLYLNKELADCWETNIKEFHICQSQLFALRNKANF